MTWSEIRDKNPKQWVLIEALEAATLDGQRIISACAVVGAYGADWRAAWDAYDRLHAESPQREFYVVHTANEVLDIKVSHVVSSQFLA